MKKTVFFQKRQIRNPDFILLSIVFILLGIGLIALFSASGVVSYEKFNNSLHLFFHQLIYGILLGAIVFLVCFKIDYHFWQKISLPLFIISLILLLFVFLPYFGFDYQGAHRWIKIGNFSFQPSEFAKLFLFIFLSSLLIKKDKTEISRKIFLLCLISLSLIFLLIILEPDFGTSLIIALTCFFLFFIAKIKLSYLFSLGMVSLGLFFLLIKIAPYRMNRLTTFLNPEIDPLGIGYHINQALIAVGSGGLFGLGLGHSRQKFNFLPESFGDSIFAIYAEELGFFISMFLILLFLIFFWRGIKISKNAPDDFGCFLAFCIVFWISIQAFINLAALLSLVPLTGIPLPFISYGSTSMVVSLAGIGILANISKSVTRNA